MRLDTLSTSILGTLCELMFYPCMLSEIIGRVFVCLLVLLTRNVSPMIVHGNIINGLHTAWRIHIFATIFKKSM
jgi:hypothetical protein